MGVVGVAVREVDGREGVVVVNGGWVGTAENSGILDGGVDWSEEDAKITTEGLKEGNADGVAFQVESGTIEGR